jgi:hypothetical protein
MYQVYGMFWAYDFNQMDSSFHITLLDEVHLQIIIIKVCSCQYIKIEIYLSVQGGLALEWDA